MARPSFGKRDVKHIELTTDRVTTVHADYVRRASPRRKRPGKRPPLAESVMVWLSYYTLVFAAIVTHTPDTAVAAVRGLNEVATKVI